MAIALETYSKKILPGLKTSHFEAKHRSGTKEAVHTI